MWHFLRLILLMSMGLGAMYMLHLLAQDYNKIRQPVAAAARALASASGRLPRGRRSISQLSFNDNGSQRIGINETLKQNWRMIIKQDYLGCLQSLICQITSGAESDSKEALLIIDFVESHLTAAPEIFATAFQRGIAFRGMPFRCYDEYPFCLYSAKTMLRILRWFCDFKLC